jgi:hypothetical protein
MIKINECQRIRYKNAGYDYYVSYKEWKEFYGSGDYLTAGFPTTKDALKKHLEAIKSCNAVQLEVITL